MGKPTYWFPQWKYFCTTTGSLIIWMLAHLLFNFLSYLNGLDILINIELVKWIVAIYYLLYLFHLFRSFLISYNPIYDSWIVFPCLLCSTPEIVYSWVLGNFLPSISFTFSGFGNVSSLTHLKLIFAQAERQVSSFIPAHVNAQFSQQYLSKKLSFPKSFGNFSNNKM